MVEKEEITSVSINQKGEFFPLIKSINMLSEIFKYLDFLDLLNIRRINIFGDKFITNPFWVKCLRIDSHHKQSLRDWKLPRKIIALGENNNLANEEKKKAMSLILNIGCLSGKLDFSFLLTNFNSRFSYKEVSFLKLFFDVMKMNGNIISLDLGDQLAIYIYIYIYSSQQIGDRASKHDRGIHFR